MASTESKDRELDAAIAEFQALRQESLHYLGERRQLLSLSVVVCTGILGYAVHAQNGYLASLPMFVASGCLIMCLAGFNGPQRIAAYVRVFIEDRHPGFNWQHALRECWRGERGLRLLAFGNKGYTVVGYLAVFASLGVVSCALTIAYASQAYALWASCLGMGILAVSSGFFIYSALYGTHPAWRKRLEKAREALIQQGFLVERHRGPETAACTGQQEKAE